MCSKLLPHSISQCCIGHPIMIPCTFDHMTQIVCCPSLSVRLMSQEVMVDWKSRKFCVFKTHGNKKFIVIRLLFLCVCELCLGVLSVNLLSVRQQLINLLSIPQLLHSFSQLTLNVICNVMNTLPYGIVWERDSVKVSVKCIVRHVATAAGFMRPSPIACLILTYS